MDADKSLGIGIVGVGNIARIHAEALKGLENIHLAGVSGRNTTRSKIFAEEYRTEHHESLESLLASKDVDIVLIASPSGAHLEPTLQAMEAGKHVLCEKPIEISLPRIQKMIDAAEAGGVKLGGFFPMRFEPANMAVKEAIDKGRFGRLVFLGARIKWWRDMSYYKDSNWRGTWAFDGGGALMNQGIHAVDLIQWFAGRPNSISARAATMAHPGIEVEDALAAHLGWDHGAMATISASTACFPGLELSVEVSGDKGTAIVTNGKIDFWSFAEELPSDAAMRSGKTAESQGGVSDPRAISCSGHRKQILDFCKEVRGEGPGIIDGVEASSAVAIVRAAYSSCSAGKNERIEYIQKKSTGPHFEQKLGSVMEKGFATLNP